MSFVNRKLSILVTSALVAIAIATGTTPSQSQQSLPAVPIDGNAVIRSRPQPFGFHAGMTQQQIITAVGDRFVKSVTTHDYGTSLSLLSAPKPSASFDEYDLKFSSEGLIEASAWTPGITSADNGSEVRDEFKEIRKLVTAKYGDPNCYDYRDSGNSDRSDFFMMYLKDKEQHLACYWKIGEDVVALETVGIDVRTAILHLTYQYYPEASRAQSLADKKKESSF